MKTPEGFASLLHHKWRLKKFNWDIEKGQFVLKLLKRCTVEQVTLGKI